jgi:hypothetical protein
MQFEFKKGVAKNNHNTSVIDLIRIFKYNTTILIKSQNKILCFPS